MLNLERLEKAALIFLVLLLFAGLAGSVYKKSHPAIDIRTGSFTSDLPQDSYEIAAYKININEASEADLTKLKGVGKVLAGRIVEYRSFRGSFVSVEDIKNVKGVGKSLYEKIKENISVE